MNYAHIYLRVSTGKQAASGLGAEAQEQACRDWCAREGLEVAGVHRDDGISGTAEVADRPGLVMALANLSKGDVLLAAKLDRFSRDTIVGVMIERMVEKSGARLASAAGEGSDISGPTGDLIRTIMRAVGQWERANAAMRTKAAMAAKRARGEYTGGRPALGTRLVKGELVEDEGEIAALQFMRAHATRGLQPAAVARLLTAAGFPTRTGKPWHRETVRRRCRDIYEQVNVRAVNHFNAGTWWLYGMTYSEAEERWTTMERRLKLAGPFNSEAEANADATARGWVLR